MKAIRQLHPDHHEQLVRLAKIEGQVKGIGRMIEERRYCIDIVQQIKAVTAGLKAVRMGVLERHVHHCVRQSVESGNPEFFVDKVDEIVKVLGQMG